MSFFHSDERTPEFFRQALDSGASTKFSVTGDQRPLCLILDEIDGAAQPAVEVLVQACKANPSRRGVKKGTGGGAKVHPLMRPVICICNDLYAPSLRELRPLALILRMTEMETVSMGLNLLNVASAEGMTTNLNDLSALAERMNYDLRACLNALQVRIKYLNINTGLMQVIQISFSLALLIYDLIFYVCNYPPS